MRVQLPKFLKDHTAGAALARHVYRDGFIDKAVRMAVQNADARALLAGLCCADIRYRTLKRRLVGIVGRRVVSRIFR